MTTLPRPSEHAEQCALVEAIAWHANQRPALALLYAIPNGGARHKATAGRLKAEGVRAGVPDLCLPVARGGYHGLYIELKARHGRASEVQRWWLGRLAAEGYHAAVCWGCDDAERLILAYEAGAIVRGEGAA